MQHKELLSDEEFRRRMAFFDRADKGEAFVDRENVKPQGVSLLQMLGFGSREDPGISVPIPNFLQASTLGENERATMLAEQRLSRMEAINNLSSGGEQLEIEEEAPADEVDADYADAVDTAANAVEVKTASGIEKSALGSVEAENELASKNKLFDWFRNLF